MSLPFGFASPWWLILLVPAQLFVWREARSSREEPEGPRRGFATLVRALLVLLLVLALAQPHLKGRDDRLDVVFAVDVSDSIGPAGLEAERAYLAAARPAATAQDRSSLVLFGGEALVEAAQLPELPLPPWASRPDSGASDPAQAVRLASALFRPGAGRRLVLLTDGEENRGSLLEAAAAARGQGIDLWLVPIAGRPGEDARLDALRAPAVAARGEPFELKAVVRAPRPGRARLRFYEGHDLLASDEVTLETAGANLFSLKARPLVAGIHAYRVEVELEGDPTPQNNAAEATVEVRGEPLVLLASSQPESLAGLAATLAQQRIASETSGVDGIPRTLAGLRRYRAVLLADIAADELGERLMALLAAYVRDAGHGLLMAGGERSFGPGGYLKTPIEEVLPVWMDVKEKRYFPSVALVAAIDKSGSMAGVGPAQKLEVAKAGAAAAIGVLGEDDEAGVVAFDDTAQWVVRLRSLREKKEILRALATLRAGGGTDIYPAMEEGYRALGASGKRVRHLILLSDGQSPARDYTGLARKMARERITVSTVAVGGDADTHTMREIAEAGKGRTYHAQDPALLPRIFTKEALTVQRSYVVEESFQARALAAHEVLAGVDLASAPPLLGYVATAEKGKGELLVASHRNDPIVALWRSGLGRSAVFTPDLYGPWTREWAAWPGYAQLLAQLVRWSAGAGGGRDIRVRVGQESGRIHIAADAVDESGEHLNLARLVAGVVSPRGERREVLLRQTAPGRYESEADAREAGAWLVAVSRAEDGEGEGAGGEAGVATIDLPASPEFRPAGRGRALLEAVAAETGARIGAEPAAVFAHDLPIPGERLPLRPALLWLLPFVLLLDVGVRRVALPEGWWARLGARLRPARRAEPALPGTLARLRGVKAAAQGSQPEGAAEPRPVVPPSVTLPPAPGAAPPPAPPGGTTGALLDARRRRQP